MSFLVTILTGKRLIPFRTQKLSPLRPMVVLTGESRSSPGFIKADSLKESAFTIWNYTKGKRKREFHQVAMPPIADKDKDS